MSVKDRLGQLALLLFVVFAALPMAAAFAYSLTYAIGLTGLLNEGLTGRHFAAAILEGDLASSLLLSALVAGVTVVLAGSMGVALALRLDAGLDRGVLSYLFYAPLAFPGTVAALVAFQWLTPSGLVARVLLRLGVISSLEGAPELVNDPYAFAIIATHVAIATPFLALVFRRLYDEGHVGELVEAAVTLGAGRRQRLLRVALPILVRRGASNLALVFVIVLGSYEIPLLLGRADPQMLSVLIMRKYGRFDVTDKPEAFAIAAIYTLIVMGFVALVFARRRGRDAS